PEGRAAQFERMAQWQPTHLRRQQFEKRFEVHGIEFLAGHKLPVDRAESVPQFAQPLIDETGDRLLGLGQDPSVGAVPRRLDREYEAWRRFVPPLGPGR